MRNGKLNDQRCLLLLLALTVFIVFLGLAAKPAYADSPDPGPDPWYITDGGGGGGQSPLPPAYIVEGYVWKNSPRSLAGPGLTVYLYFAGQTIETTTDARGYFRFQGSYIYANYGYMVTVNGIRDQLGYHTDDMHWGQWRGFIQTNSLAYGFRHIYLEAAAIVNVPVAVLYSDTAYTQSVAYFTGSSHDLSFRATVGSTGFMTSQSWVRGITWAIHGQHTAQYGKRYYAVGYYDDVGACIASAGLSGEFDKNEIFQSIDVPEYLTPDLSKPNYGLPTDATPRYFIMGESESASFQYTETGSFTWSRGFSGSVGIEFNIYNLSVNIDVTATETWGHTNTISFMVGPLPPGTPHHKFVIYTRGFTFTMPNNNPNDPNNRGGLEFHIWDAGETT